MRFKDLIRLYFSNPTAPNRAPLLPSQTRERRSTWRWAYATLALAAFTLIQTPLASAEDDFMVYSVYSGFPMGPGDVPKRDYFLNMGSKHGLKSGSTVEVYRKQPTYDLVNRKLMKDVTFGIATLKIIHVEADAAIARLESMHSADTTPSISPRAVLVGDLVRAR